MEDAARAAHPDEVVVLVSDHGFAPITHEVHITNAFVEAGLVTLDDKHRIASWEAMPWITGGSSAIMLARPDDAALKARSKPCWRNSPPIPIAACRASPTRAEIARLGGGRGQLLGGLQDWLSAQRRAGGPLVVDGASVRGSHGYFPEHAEMHSTFLIEGPGIPAGKNLGEIDMRDIAPTVARVLNVSLPSAQGKPLF